MWNVYHEKLENYGCIEHSVTKELCIVTKHSDVWEKSKTEMSCIVYSTIFAKRLAKFLKVDDIDFNTIQSGTEFLFTFKKTELDKVMKILQFKNNRQSMVKYAESRS